MLKDIHVGRLVDGLAKSKCQYLLHKTPMSLQWPWNFIRRAYIVREREGQLQLVRHGFGIGSALSGDAEGSRPCSESRPGKTKGHHGAMGRGEACSIGRMACRTLRVESLRGLFGLFDSVLSLIWHSLSRVTFEP